MKFFVHDIEVKDIRDTDGIVRNLTVPLRCYIPDISGATSYHDGNRPAVIIFPGGGYSFTYSGEAEPIALKYAAEGICAFVLDYSCDPIRFPIPQLEAFYAIRYVREHAKEFGLNPRNIATSGFSAGGHLCASTGTLWNKPEMEEYLGTDRRIFRPDKLILCYPVIKSTTRFAHAGSIINLLGKDNLTDELVKLVSLEQQVDDETPPTFIWHTSEDTCVPIRNTLDFATALSDRGIPTVVHIYLHGNHGLCLGTCVTTDLPYSSPYEVSEWIDKAIRFAYDETLISKE